MTGNLSGFASWRSQTPVTVVRLEYRTWLLFRNGGRISSDTLIFRSEGKAVGIGEISVSVVPIERLDVLRIWNFSQI